MAADFASALTAKVGFKGFGIEEEKLATKAKFEYEGAEYEIGHGAQRTLPSRPRLSMLTDGFPPPVRCRFPRNRGHYLVMPLIVSFDLCDCAEGLQPVRVRVRVRNGVSVRKWGSS